MLDTIDFIIENINITELQNDIVFNKNTKQFSNKYTNTSITFVYKTIHFVYYFLSHCLIIHTNAHSILNKIDISIQDKKVYINKVNNILNKVIINFDSAKLKLMRIDYHVDLNLNEALNTYIELLNNSVKVYNYMKKRVEYDSSIHLNTKHGKQNINIYNKYEETNNPLYIGILRVEIQIKKRLLKSEFKKYGITRELDNYWNKNSMENYFFRIVEGFCFKGDYYKRNIANEIIETSNHSNSMKQKLNQFLLDVEKKGLEQVKQSNKYNACKINDRISKLTLLNINPIPLPKLSKYDKLQSLYLLTKEIVKEKYFL